MRHRIPLQAGVSRIGCVLSHTCFVDCFYDRVYFLYFPIFCESLITWFWVLQNLASSNIMRDQYTRHWATFCLKHGRSYCVLVAIVIFLSRCWQCHAVFYLIDPTFRSTYCGSLQAVDVFTHLQYNFYSYVQRELNIKLISAKLQILHQRLPGEVVVESTGSYP